jgi:hypothetical protein
LGERQEQAGKGPAYCLGVCLFTATSHPNRSSTEANRRQQSFYSKKSKTEQEK